MPRGEQTTQRKRRRLTTNGVTRIESAIERIVVVGLPITRSATEKYSAMLKYAGAFLRPDYLNTIPRMNGICCYIVMDADALNAAEKTI